MIIQSEERQAQSRRGSREALRWSAVDAVGRQGISFAVAVVLARLLCPAEFGLVGMLCIFSALASSIVDSGFGSALIQRKAITETDKSSVFYFNVVIGAAGAATLLIAAPPVAHFYRQPLLVPMMRWMALNLFIESLGVVQVALLTRNLDFRSQFKAGFLALLISGTVGVGMAATGHGVWSLVAQTVTFTTVFTGVVWVLCSWRPGAAFSARSLRDSGFVRFSFASFGTAERSVRSPALGGDRKIVLGSTTGILHARLHHSAVSVGSALNHCGASDAPGFLGNVR